MHRLSDILYDLFTANAKGTDGCVVVLDEDRTLVDEDDVLKELEKNTVVMIIKSQDAWNPVASVSTNKPQGDQNVFHGNRNTHSKEIGKTGHYLTLIH